MGGGSKVVAVVMMVFIMVAGHASATAASHTPNSWSSCMADCPKYKCSSWMPTVACDAYCGTLCAIPPKANSLMSGADAADRFCKLGCISSKCSTLASSMFGAQAVEGCIHDCSDICSSSSAN